MPQKKCDFQKNQNKKNWRIRLFGGSNVVNKLLKEIKNQASSHNLKSLTQKTKIWGNNTVSGRFGKYSFHLKLGRNRNYILAGNTLIRIQ